MTAYLANVTDPVPLVLDIRIAHDRFGSSSDLHLNGHFHYPIRKYRSDYNNNPPNSISFMSVVPSTSGKLHSEFVRLLFLQVHRETDHFFAESGVQFVKHDRGQFHFHRATSLHGSKEGLG